MVEIVKQPPLATGNVKAVVSSLPNQGRQIDYADSYIIRAKAERYVFANYRIRSGILQALSITQSCLRLDRKETTNFQRVINWSGARPGWKRSMHAWLEGSITEQLIERIKVNSGFTLKITPKGHEVLRAFEQRCLEIAQLILDGKK